MVVISWVIALKSNNSFDNHVASEEQHLKIALFLLQWYSIVLVSMHCLGINGCSRTSKLQVGRFSYRHCRSDSGLLKWRTIKVSYLNYVNPVLFWNIKKPLRIYQTVFMER